MQPARFGSMTESFAPFSVFPIFVPDANVFFRLPIGATEKAMDIEVTASIAKHKALVSESSRREYREPCRCTHV